jgi:indole-3-glycerol phosphate synthase
MNDMLARLYAAKADALRAEEEREPYDVVLARAEARRPERRSFAGALRSARGPGIVAEIKRASPSVGLIARNFDPAGISADYESAGADAISVLTEADHFLGDLAYLDAVRAQTSRPLLRKDFLTSPYQIAQSAAYGADAVLLIVAGLDDERLRSLAAEATRFALDVLFEVHDDDDLRRVLLLRPALIGINNRDLRTFETDLGVTEHLLPAIPTGTLVISESGVQTPQDVAYLHACGAHAFLVGESLMRAEDRTAFLAALKGAPVENVAFS